MTDDQLIGLLSTDEVFGLTLYGEARGEGETGIRAVAQVVRNRVRSGRIRQFGEGYRGVCLKRLQFSCWSRLGGSRNYELLLDASRTVLRGTAECGPVLRSCIAIARDTALERPDDVDLVHGATHYVTKALLVAAPPAWAKGLTPVAEIGDHVFFAGVS